MSEVGTFSGDPWTEGQHEAYRQGRAAERKRVLAMIDEIDIPATVGNDYPEFWEGVEAFRRALRAKIEAEEAEP